MYVCADFVRADWHIFGDFFMHILYKISLVALCCGAFQAHAADVADFDSFYNEYKNSADGALNITADITATRLLGAGLAQNVVIDGGGFDFTSISLAGFSVVAGDSITLNNGGAFSLSGDRAVITKSFGGFAQSSRGGVFVNSGGNVSVSNSAFSGNTAVRGGGVFYQTNNAELTVVNSAFDGNRVTLGDGAVIFNEYETTAKITDSYFQNNVASRYGGVVFNDGTMDIDGGAFISNSADSGGAIYNSNSVTIKNTIFSDNSALDETTGVGGAIYNTGAMEIDSVTFNGNRSISGGAIGNYGGSGDGLFAVIKNSDFVSNSASGYGGAIYNFENIYIIDSNFTNNSATEFGGAIFNFGTAFLISLNSDMVFSGNTAAGQSNAVDSSGTLHLNAADGRSIVFNDRITGDGEIIINRPYSFDGQNIPAGGTIILNNDMGGFSGNIDIDGGLVRVGDGGTFFDADALNVNGGTLDIGISQVAATSATFGAGTTLALTIADANTYGTLTSNTFAIDAGANLSAILKPDAMGGANSIRVQLLKSPQAISDNFMPAFNNNIYEFTQLGDGWYEVHTANSYIDVIKESGGSQNNENTATAWQRDPSNSNGELSHQVYEELDYLVQSNAIEYIKALTALAPSPAPLTQVLTSSYMDKFDRLTDSDPRAQWDIGRGVLWAAGLGNTGRIDKSGLYGVFDIYGYGVGAGAEFSRRDWTFGAAYMHQYDRLKSWARTIHTPTNGGGLYATYLHDGFVLRGRAVMFISSLEETKNVGFVRLENNPLLYTMGAQSDIGYKFTANKWNITPRVGARYTFAHKTSSTDGAGQRITAENRHFFTTYANMEFGREFYLARDFRLVPSVELGGSYDLRADRGNSTVYINGAKYDIVAETLAPWQANAALKLALVFPSGARLQIGADVGLREGYTNYTGMIKGGINF